MKKFNIKKYFPYENIRKQQEEIINFALHNFLDNNKKFVIVEAGTGVGKSAIGVTVANYLNDHLQSESDKSKGAYYLTTQKVLQQQYIKDFATIDYVKMKSLQSASNYKCKYYTNQTCAESLPELKVSKDDSFKLCCAINCNYSNAKKEFDESDNGVTNFSYFLTEKNYSGKLSNKKIMIIDECHNVETEMSKFVEMTFTQYFAEKILKIKVPEVKTQYQVLKWVKESYLPALVKARDKMEKLIESTGIKERISEFVMLEKKWKMVDGHLQKIVKFFNIYDKNNWIMNIVKTDRKNYTKWEFKPIDVSPYTDEVLFSKADKILLMSATIINKDAFCRVLGIKKEDCAFISTPSPFPIDNKPILISGVGSMSLNNIEASLPRMAIAIQAILQNHKGQKGIIHCHNYKIAKYLKEKLKTKRLLTHTSEDRDKILNRHIYEKSPTVLLSPSMQEGVDLKGKASEFQILCKVPYPYLGDKLVKKRMHKWNWWYSLQTVKIIIQSVGRSIRSADDKAVTYILDSDWNKFYNRNKDIFPLDFRKSIIK